jgi:hypothetical protein
MWWLPPTFAVLLLGSSATIYLAIVVAVVVSAAMLLQLRVLAASDWKSPSGLPSSVSWQMVLLNNALPSEQDNSYLVRLSQAAAIRYVNKACKSITHVYFLVARLPHPWGVLALHARGA